MKFSEQYQTIIESKNEFKPGDKVWLSVEQHPIKGVTVTAGSILEIIEKQTSGKYLVKQNDLNVKFSVSGKHLTTVPEKL